MARRIQRHVDGDYRKAMLITRTEAHRVREAGFNDAATDIDNVFKANNSDFRMTKTWHNVGDEAVRKTGNANHVDMEGQTVLQDEKFTMIGSGAKADHPGASGVASEDCNCRCFLTQEIMNDAEFYAATGRHFNKHFNEKAFTTEEKRGIIYSENDIDYMSNSFRPKYGAESVSSVGDIHIPVKRVTNSQFELYTDVENTEKNKAVRLTEKNMRVVAGMMDADFEFPKIVVVDFDKYNFKETAIGGYNRDINTMFINSKYDTNKKIIEYVNKAEGYFANKTQYAPYLHELGHKQYEDALEAYAKRNGITVERARYIVENRLAEYISGERTEDIDFIGKNISEYAEYSYKNHLFSEVFAEGYSVENKNIYVEHILGLFEKE